MRRLISILALTLVLGVASGCENSENMADSNLDIKEAEVTLEQGPKTIDIFNLLTSNLNIRMNLIADSMKSIETNQEVLDVLFKDEEDYDTLFAMIQEREEVIRLCIDEIMVKTPSIHRIYFLTEDGDLILDSSSSDTDLEGIRPSDSEGINVIPYSKAGSNRIVFQASLRYTPTREYAYVIFEVSKEDIMMDVYQTQISISENYIFEVRDLDGTNLIESYDLEEFETIHSMINTYEWEISMLMATDE